MVDQSYNLCMKILGMMWMLRNKRSNVTRKIGEY